MNYLKQVSIGFLISFVGSIPLGYLNFVGFEIYKKSSLKELINYLFGVVLVEGIIIYSTFYFALKLNLNPKLKSWISIFSIVFLILLTYYFYPNKNQVVDNYKLENKFLSNPSFIIGLILSCLNFAQIPFWFSWNIYLVNEKYISSTKNMIFIYVLGTLLGTFSGMLLLILGLKKLTNHGFVSENFISQNIWIIFLSLTIFQIYQFFKKKN